MLLLGIDLGSSSVKASVIDGESGKCLATAFYPSDEMKIIALKPDGLNRILKSGGQILRLP